MTVKELYELLEARMPRDLSCEWDNDGLLCCPDPERQVSRVLVALDITRAVVEEAIEKGYDLILSHHPLIFRPLRAVEPSDPVAAKVIRLLCAGVSAMSFHTRLDAVTGGVNDVLCEKLGLFDVTPFGENGESIGRIGTLSSPMTVREFAERYRTLCGAEGVCYSDAGLSVCRVALLGGGGSGEVACAKRAGADTYLTGELKHDQLTDAPDRGMNLVMGGHFHTENPVCERLRDWLLEADSTLTVDLIDSNPVKWL